MGKDQSCAVERTGISVDNLNTLGGKEGEISSESTDSNPQFQNLLKAVSTRKLAPPTLLAFQVFEDAPLWS